jgi:hypothetical protein
MGGLARCNSMLPSPCILPRQIHREYAGYIEFSTTIIEADVANHEVGVSYLEGRGKWDQCPSGEIYIVDMPSCRYLTHPHLISKPTPRN